MSIFEPNQFSRSSIEGDKNIGGDISRDFNNLQQEAIVTATIYPYRYGQVSYQGSWWLAHCHQPITLLPDTLVWVIQREGIRLLVDPIEFTESVPTEAFFTSTPSTPCGEEGTVTNQSNGKVFHLPIKSLIGMITGFLLLSVPPALAANRMFEAKLGDRASVVSEMQMLKAQAQQMVPAVYYDCGADVNREFCNSWLNEANRYSAYWSNIPSANLNELLLDGLDGLSESARYRLGNYSEVRQVQMMHRFRVSEIYVNNRANDRFFTLFPQRSNPTITHAEEKTYQIWLACREDVLIQLRQEIGRRY